MHAFRLCIVRFAAENSVQKIQIVADTAVREVDAGKKLRDELHKSMQKTEKDIAELKDRVAHERVLRQHKEEYALLAQKVQLLLLLLYFASCARMCMLCWHKNCIYYYYYISRGAATQGGVCSAWHNRHKLGHVL